MFQINRDNILIYVLIFILVTVISFVTVHWISFPKATKTSDEFIDVFSEPIQTETQELPFSTKINSLRFFITPMADYDISAVVVSSKRYHRGIDAKVVPLDLGVCWGDIAKEENRKKIKFQQYLRFLTYRFKEDLPFSMEYLSSHAGNIHIIPANKRIKRVMFSLDKNDSVRLKGYLVKVIAQNQKYSYYHRGTSLSRDDTGDGACELMWVKEVQIGKKVYQ